jgi:hypothetical protein
MTARLHEKGKEGAPLTDLKASFGDTGLDIKSVLECMVLDDSHCTSRYTSSAGSHSCWWGTYGDGLVCVEAQGLGHLVFLGRHGLRLLMGR